MKKHLLLKLTSMLFFSFIANSAYAIDILPHQAHYSLSMQEVNMPGIKSSRGGDFFIRIEKACDSWVLASQFSFSMDGEDGVPLDMFILSKWEETLDGQSMNFHTQTIINGSTAEVFEGVANNSKNDSPSKLYLSQPGEATVDLPPNLYFPLSATKQSMENIIKGQVVQNYLLYDGASDKAVRVSDLKAGKAILADDIPETAKAHLNGDGWRVVTSFFDLGQADGEATSTHVSDIFENGVTSWLKISSPQLVAIGTLVEFETVPLPKCNG